MTSSWFFYPHRIPLSLEHAQERYDGRDMQHVWRAKNAYRLTASKTEAEKLLGMRDVNYSEDREVGTAYLKGS